MQGLNAFGRSRGLMAQIAAIISMNASNRGGTRCFQRAALKARNVQANRRAHR